MAEARVTQASLTAGEISPELYGRHDLAKYQVGCRFLENFYVQAYGGVQNRPGFMFAGEVKDSTKKVRLQRFEAAGDQAFLMEMGDLYFRYFYRGGVVLDGMSTSETVTPYTEANLDTIYTAQSNDVLTITSNLYPVNELSNVSDGVWTLSAVDFAPGITPPTGLSIDTVFGITDQDDIGYDKDPKPSRYRVSAITEEGEESRPSGAQSSGNNVLGFEKNYNTLEWNPVTGADSYNIYKAQNGVFGYIGFTTDTEFKDSNYLPDLTRGIVTAKNPFNAVDKYPAVCSFCQQRRVFGATILKPQSIFMSVSADFDSMQISKPARDDDAIEFALAANRKQDIFHILNVDNGMIVFTRSGEWVVTGREGDVITPSSILPKPQSTYGAHQFIQPLIVGEQMLFVPSSARLVYEMEYNIQVDRYKAANLALLSSHLFRDREIVSWDFAERPNGIAWCVMSDGEILSLTYLKEHDVWGWARHTTQGNALDVCVVPEGGFDTPYFLMERRNATGVKKFIEYLPQRDFTEVEDCFFVDSGLRYANSAAAAAAAGGVLTAATFAPGDLVLIKGMTFTDINGDVAFDFSGRYVVNTVIGGGYSLRTEDGDAVSFATAISAAYVADSGALIYKSTSSVSGMDHLEGRTVVALADGNVIDDLMVIDGVVDLGDEYFRVSVGLPYASTLWSMDILNPQNDATGVERASPRAFVMVDRSRGYAVGVTPESVEDQDTRLGEDWGAPGALISETVEVTLLDGWSNETTAAVVQKYPLPLTVLTITPEMNYGG